MMKLIRNSFLFLLLCQLIEINHGDTRFLNNEAEILSEESSSANVVSSVNLMEDDNEIRNLQVVDTSFFSTLNVALNDTIFQVDIPGMGKNLSVTVTAENAVLSDASLATGFSITLDAKLNFQGYNENSEYFEAYVVLNGVNVQIRLGYPLQAYKYTRDMKLMYVDEESVGICVLMSSSEKHIINNFNIVSYEYPVYDGSVSFSDRLLMENLLNDIKINSKGFLSFMTTGFRKDVGNLGVTPVVRELLSAYNNYSRCDTLVMASQYLDFREFFLSAEESKKLGGTGMTPYGDFGTAVYTAINGLLDLEEGGSFAGINGLLPSKITFLEVERFEINRTEIPELTNYLRAAGIDSFFVEIKDGYVENLNTFVPPLDVLKPSNKPHVLTNRIELGYGGLPVSASITVRAGIVGIDSPFSFGEEFSLIVTFDSLKFTLDLLATVSAPELINFNVVDFLKIPCWLALIPNTDDADMGLQVPNYTGETFGLGLMINCTSCTPSVNASLNEALDILEEDDLSSRLNSQLGGIINEVMRSETPTTILNHFLETSKELCPVYPEYNETAKFDSDFIVKIPPFSRQSVETMVLLIVVVVQIAFITGTNLILKNDNSTKTDPLNGQERMEAIDIDFLDFRAFDVERADAAADFDVFDLIEAGLSFAGGNSFFSSNILSSVMDMLGLEEKDGLFGDTFMYDLGFKWSYQESSARFGDIRVKGFDSVEELDIFKVIGPQTVSSKIKMANLRFEADIYLSGPNSQETTPFTVVFEFEDLEAVASVLVAVDNGNLNSLNLQNVMDLKTIGPCIGSIFHTVEVTELFAKVGKIKFLEISGFVSEIADDALGIQSRIGDYLNNFVASTPVIFDQITLLVINNIVTELIYIADTFCESDFQESAEGYVDFRDLVLPPEEAILLGGSGEAQYGDVIYKLFEVIKLFLEEDDSGNFPVLINKYIPNSESGISIPGEVVRLNDYFEFMGFRMQFDLSIKDLTIYNLNTLGKPLDLFKLKDNEPYFVNNTATLGVGAEPVRIEVSSDLNFIFGENTAIVNELTISVDMYSLTVFLGGLIKLHEKKFMNYPITQLLNTDCLLTLVEFNRSNFRSGVRLDDEYAGVVISDLMLLAKKLDIKVDCKQCDSPALEELSKMLLNPESSDEIKTFIGNILNFVTGHLKGQFLHDIIDQALDQASRNCILSPKFDPYANDNNNKYASSTRKPKYETSYSLLYASLKLFVSVIAICFGALTFHQQIAKRRNFKWMMTLSTEDYNLYKDKERRNDEITLRMNKSSQPLFLNPEIPFYVRLSVPFIVIVNAALFASGHVNLGANANLYITALGDTFVVNGVYQMAILPSTLELWRFGSKAAASIIACVSIIWPYVKQLTTLIMWLIPTNLCTVSTRGWILLLLDNLAKWSMVDIMALVISVVALRIQLKTPSSEFLPNDLIGFDIWVVPKWGLYANLIAQLLSQVSSHFIIHYHRKVAYAAENQAKAGIMLSYGVSILSITEKSIDKSIEEVEDIEDSKMKPEGKKESLQSHAYVRPRKAEGDHLLVKAFVAPMLVSISATTVILFILSAVVYPSIAVETLGIFGLVEEAAQNWKQALYSYNIIDLINVHIEESIFLGTVHDFIGITSFWLLLIITVLFVPIFQVIGLLCIWFIPMTPFYLKRMLILNECLSAWQYSEPFMLAVIIEVWQLQQLSDFLVNPLCRTINSFFYQLNYYDVIKDEDAQCFMRIGSPESGIFIMFAAVCCLYFLELYVTKAARQYLREHDNLDTITNDDRKYSSMKSKPTEVVDESSNDIYDEKSKRQLKSFPFLFTDAFRWAVHHHPKKAHSSK